jgi:hypothetical protein
MDGIIMIGFFKSIVKKIFNLLGYNIVKLTDEQHDPFLTHHYQRHTRRRLEHLASLGLSIAGSTVLEVGAGVGDHTDFYIDRGCHIVTSDARQDNIKVLRLKYPDIRVLHLDMDYPPGTFKEVFDIAHCYGLLYHLKHPDKALEFLSHCCRRMLILSTCVSYGDDDLLNPITENKNYALYSVRGSGCKPTRRWVYNQLKKHFEYVYLPITQPNHEEFPIDWSLPSKAKHSRAVFIASRQKLNSSLLREEIPMKQIRH